MIQVHFFRFPLAIGTTLASSWTTTYLDPLKTPISSGLAWEKEGKRESEGERGRGGYRER